MLIGPLLNLLGLKRRAPRLLKTFLLLIARRVDKYKHWINHLSRCGENCGSLKVALTVHHNKKITDCNFPAINSTKKKAFAHKFHPLTGKLEPTASQKLKYYSNSFHFNGQWRFHPQSQ